MRLVEIGTFILAASMAACGGSDTSSEKVNIPPSVSNQSFWPNINRNIVIVGSTVNCEKNPPTPPSREEAFLFPDQEANIKGFIMKAPQPGEITGFRGEGIVDKIVPERGKTLLDISVGKVKAHIVAEGVRPANAAPGTFIVANFECKKDENGPAQQ